MNDDRVRLPRIEQVILDDLSLYKSASHIEVRIDESSVFCLVGANGLGKSTFLSAVSFGLTGAVPPPDGRFRDVPRYYRDSMRFSRDYFTGRISERDAARSVVKLRFTIGDRTYHLARNFFEPQALREFRAFDAAGILIAGSLAPQLSEGSDDLHSQYVEQVVEDTSLSSFAQMVFIQHFLLTFDERRHLLFWDEKVASQVLMLAFGLDPESVAHADEWQKEVEGQDSLARNAQYDATQARGRLTALRQQLVALGEKSEASVDPDRLADEHDELEEARDRADAEVIALLDGLRDAQLELAASSARLSQAQKRYEQLFQSRFLSIDAVENHPIVEHAIRNSECKVCGTKGDRVASSVRAALDRRECPFCTAPLDEPASVVPNTELLDADVNVARRRADMDEADAKVQAISKSLDLARQQQSDARQSLADFEQENEASLARTSDNSLSQLEGQYQAVVDTALIRKNEHLQLKAEFQALLQPLQAQLLEAYDQAQTRFIPLFQDLAHDFLGLPLQVDLVGAGSTRVRLLLSIQGSRRRMTSQLSESQRYFLDIALRMALVQYMEPGERVSLYIDTPEGSLDIAHEARVGDMFARFVESDYGIVMTANVNSSQLLLQLALRCGRQGMHVEQMSQWTTLSDVQVAGLPLFGKALRRIEAALDGEVEEGEV